MTADSLGGEGGLMVDEEDIHGLPAEGQCNRIRDQLGKEPAVVDLGLQRFREPVSYTHLRAHETVLELVCRLLLEKKTIVRLTLIHP